MRISFLHTADAHVETFDRLFEQLGGGIELKHRVEPSLLDRAREEGLESVRDDTISLLGELSAADAVICTCSTLGPLADDLSRSIGHVFRIDRPVMESACKDGENILVAICLESTREPTLALLRQCATQLGCEISPQTVLCQAAWPYFESGDIASYAAEIARTVKAEISRRPRTDCIVLAQASMHVAEDLLRTVGVPVKSSPLLAAEYAIEVARARMAGQLQRPQGGAKLPCC